MEDNKSPFVEVSPNPSKLNQNVKIVVKNLTSGNSYSLYSCTTTSKNGDRFECLAHYNANSQGDIDITSQPSVGGFYTGIEPMALVWDLRSSSKSKKQRAVRHEHAIDILLKVFDGFLSLDDAISQHLKNEPATVAEVLISRLGERINKRKASLKDIEFTGPLVVRSVSDVTNNNSTSLGDGEVLRNRLFSTEF